MPTDPRADAPTRRVALRRAAHKGAYDRPTWWQASAKVRTGPPEDDERDVDPDVWAGVVPVARGFSLPVPAPGVDPVDPATPVPSSVQQLVDRGDW